MGGIAGGTKPGNTVLINYGIQNEKSEMRAHVSVVGRCVYVYKTSSGLAAIKKKDYRKVPAMTGDVVTAMGYIVPPNDIQGIRVVDIPDKIMMLADFNERDTTTEKGDKAVRIIKWMLKSGVFPLSVSPDVITDRDLQIDGADIIVRLEARIQVKCDYRSGDRAGCTGNLFLQIAECNPYSNH